MDGQTAVSCPADFSALGSYGGYGDSRSGSFAGHSEPVITTSFVGISTL
jgi:hypothetical protein